VDDNGPRRGHVLPSLATALVPRHRELGEIRHLLEQDELRLVTLVGPPGSGKTRLAMAVAERLSSSFRHGAVFVDLVPVSDATLVPSAIAMALGIRDMGDRALAESLVAVLRDRELLLVLDNFEHLLPASPQIAELLARCPRLKVLATSRGALRLEVEYQYAVAPLAVPRPEQSRHLQVLSQVPSVVLFCLRARSVRHNWLLDTANAGAVAEICIRLDGLPLAIELAAAWMHVLSPRAILARLEACLDARQRESEDRPARHRTLRAAIAWSYELLEPQERAAFERLSVFAGGWTQEAAAAVCKRSPDDMLHVLASLADKHLVYTSEQPDGEPRFHMLVTLRAFARSQLAVVGADDETRRRHALFFLALAEQAEPELAGEGQRAWLDRLELEFDNLRLALGWALERAEADVALRLAGALWFFWDMRGHLREGRQWLERILDLPTARTPTPARVAALNAAGWLALVQGDYPSSVALHETSLELARALHDAPSIARSAMFLGLALGLGPREYDRALTLYAESLPIGRQMGDMWIIGLVLYGQGHVAAMRGDLARTDALWGECLEVCAAVGSLYAQSYLQFRWGILAVLAKDYVRAQTCLVKALELGREVDSAREMGVAMDVLAWVAVARGQVERAARLFGAAEALLDEAGYNVPSFMQEGHERAVAAVRAALEADVFAALWAAGRQLSRDRAVAYARGHHAEASGRPAVPMSPLTRREWQVARLLGRGLTNRQIAEQLVITERTVGAHLEHIYAKLGIPTRALLAVWAAEQEALLARGSPGARARSVRQRTPILRLVKPGRTQTVAGRQRRVARAPRQSPLSRGG